MLKVEKESDLLDTPRGHQENHILNAAIDLLVQNHNLQLSEDQGESPDNRPNYEPNSS